ncbi:MAG: transposase [Verrucomicrobiia bacterium]
MHADETFVSIKGKRAYVWVLTNMHEVVYLYSATREAEFVQEILKEFKGVLVSDFYAAYDAIPCPQQKCLIHLARDLNGELLDHPFDEALKCIIQSFGVLVRAIVQEIDRHGLKRHFLHKFQVQVKLFYRDLIDVDYQSPVALACAERFRKNRDRLFTFLDYDGVPWNNNNAEHAIKAFAKLREVIHGCSTEKGIADYLILLSVCETCRYQGLDFLDFLRSGETDISAFAEARVRRRSHRTTEPF